MVPPGLDINEFLLMARSIAGETGQAMLVRLVETQSTHLNAVFVAVTHGEGNPVTHVRASYALESQQAVREVHYALEGTPCARVFGGEVVTVPCGLAELYPKEAGYEGYVGIPLRDNAGEVAGHLVVFTDTGIREAELVTAICSLFALRAEAELRRMVMERERTRLIADLSRLNARLQGAYSGLRRENAERTNLMGLIAHDLRSPLSALMSQAELGFARTRAPSPDNGRIETAFGKVIDNAERIASLIDATLERSRAEGKALCLRLRPANLASLVRVAAEANRDEAERKSISLSVEAVDEIAAEVDETLVTSAIDNLIGNAVKYTHPGGSVGVAAECDGESVSISVTDTGQGLSPDDLLRVFGRFQILSARPTAGETSTGLGLANVREIAQAHGGSVDAWSEGKGKGSRFRMVLPCKPLLRPEERPA